MLPAIFKSWRGLTSQYGRSSRCLIWVQSEKSGGTQVPLPPRPGSATNFNNCKQLIYSSLWEAINYSSGRFAISAESRSLDRCAESTCLRLSALQIHTSY